MPVAHYLRQLRRVAYFFLEAIDIYVVIAQPMHLRKFHIRKSLVLKTKYITAKCEMQGGSEIADFRLRLPIVDSSFL